MISSFENKFFKQRDLLKLVEERQNNGERAVFTNGCFDLIHVGHLRYLEKARRLGDFLIIGLNSDSSVQKLKGKGRPFMPEKDRAEILSALVFVDYVVIFSEETPEKLIGALKPDFHVKGGDYRKEDLPELKIVETYGGEIVILDHVPGKSTTNISEEIIKKWKDKNKGFIEV